MSGENAKSWPVGYQFTLALFGLIFVGFLWVGLPVLSTLKFGQGVAVGEIGLWAPMIATLLALTTMTVTAIFLFMTFRIDRGTRLKAEETAKSVLQGAKDAAEAAKTEAEKAADEAKEEAKKAASKAASQCADDFQKRLAMKIEERCQDKELDRLIATAFERLVSEESLRDRVDQLLRSRLDEAAVRELIDKMLTKWIENLSPQERKALVRALLDALKRLKRRNGWLAKLFGKFRKQG